MDAESGVLSTVRGRKRGRPSRGAAGGSAPVRQRSTSSTARGTGRGKRGRAQQQEAQREAAAAALLNEKKGQIREVISGLPEVEVRGVLAEAVEKNPDLLFEIIERRNRPESPEPQPASSRSLHWCSCTFCRDMPTDVEKVCCGKQRDLCISRLANFQLIALDEEVLDVARLYRQDMLAFPAENDQNRGRRHAAYRQFTLWQHGRLGAGNRLVIPSCCVWRIRDKYPDQFGQYTGFIPGRLG